ncbi:class I SAM-dependent methyltransferase [Marinilabiliaceae bacterium ANBcel2]|nr:class I SAM-dependent methyltransferase [Marinilabiliaceae bacterium ANBcel2]
MRKLFYGLLDLLLLRAWHLRKEFRTLKKAGVNLHTVFDAGSGFGQYVWRIARLFPNANIKGVDIKDEQVEECNTFFSKVGLSHRVSFEVADLTRYVVSNGYDLILSVDVMEHIEEDEKVIKNFFLSLRKGGVVIISTPSDKGGSDAHDHEGEGATGFIDEHVRDGYNIDDIRDKLKQAGFLKVYARYTYGKPGKLSWKMTMKIPVIMLNKSKLFFIFLPFYYLIVFPIAALLNYFDVIIAHKEGTGLLIKAIK